jgi:hypothetical protein
MMNAQPTLYVVISSSHNVAEYRCLLNLTPESVLIVSSTTEDGSAQRLASVIGQGLPDTKIHFSPADGQNALEGDKGQSIQRWVEQSLQPLLHEYRNNGTRIILNLTGGTKLMAVFIQRAFPWHEIHYLALGAEHFERYDCEMRFAGTVELPVTVPLLHQGQLYMDKVTLHTPTSVERHPEAVAVAEYLHQQYATAGKIVSINRPLDLPWILLAQFIEEQSLWHSHFNGPEWQRIDIDGIYPLSDAWQSLVAILRSIGSFIEERPEGLYLATVRYKSSEDWRHFLAGTWFELLLKHWLASYLPHIKVLSSVQLHADKQDRGRESDLLVAAESGLMVVEAKVHRPATTSARAMQDQLKNTALRVGRVHACLVFSPAGPGSFKPAAWADFQNSCRVAGIKLVVANRPEDFLAVVAPRKFSPVTVTGESPMMPANQSKASQETLP